MNRRWLRSGGLTIGAVLLGIALTLEVYVSLNEPSRHAPPDFIVLAIGQFGRVLLWVLTAPLILRLYRMRPLRGKGWILHAIVSVLFMSTFYLGRLYSARLFGLHAIRWELRGDFWQVAMTDFAARNLLDFAFYWAVLIYGHEAELQHRVKQEELKAAQLESRLIDTELKMLREQLRPHFLFNTLNTISVQVREGKRDEAVGLIAQLASLLRMSLDHSRAAQVTVREELRFLDRYLAIQQIRFADRMTVRINVTPEAMEVPIPNLLLQPLVENAVIHGISAKSSPGVIEVKGWVEAARLRLEIRNDGPPLPPRGQLKEGIGLGNARERLERIYGPESELSLSDHPEGGVAVKIVLPCRL